MTHLEALRCLKRRLSDVVYRCLVADQAVTSPGGQRGASTRSCAADLNPTVDSSEQSFPGLGDEPTPPTAAAF